MDKERNQVYALVNLEAGDRFHLPGKKKQLATMLKHVHNSQTHELWRIEVQKDGDAYPSYMKPDTEVVYLRNIHQ